MQKRWLLSCVFLLVSLSLVGCWEDFYVPKAKSTNVGGNASDDWERDLTAILKDYVNADGLVDYTGLSQTETRAKVNGIVAALEKVDPTGWTEDQKLAFWINAYNISMIWNILDKYEEVKKGLVTDFSDLFFKQRAFSIAGQTVSLDQLEHNILRREAPIDGVSVEKLSPEIHVAISCAALSCPPIRPQIWKADTVRKELDAQMRKIANDKRFVSLENGKPSLTTLADWFFDDFRDDGKTVGDFFADRLDGQPELQKALREAGDDKTKFVFKPYDWKLNDWVR